MEQRITALQVQENNPQRINVFLDGGYAFGLSRIVAAWLRVGQFLDEEKISSLLKADEQEKAFQQALKLLHRRDHTEEEVRKNLYQHHYPEETIRSVIQRLQEKGFLNDLHFAENWVENRTTFRPRSKKTLTFELHRHGVDSETILQVTEGLNEDELAYQAGIKQAHKYDSSDWSVFRKKLAAYLLRRGFNYETVSLVIHRIWTEINSGDDSHA